MSLSPLPPSDPESPISPESRTPPAHASSRGVPPKPDLLLQIYSSLGIDYDELTGEYRVRP
jgi:hypothetical protein